MSISADISSWLNTIIQILISIADWTLKILPDTKVLIGFIIGAIVTYQSQKIFKNREIKNISFNNANYVALLLCQERASLKKISHFVEDRKNKKPHQKMFILPTFMEIKQDSIEKILAHQKFFKYNYAQVIQSLVASEQSYRNCFKLITSYNETLQKLIEIRAQKTDKNLSALEAGYTVEINCYVENIFELYNEAISLNEQTKEHFDSLCKKVFKKSYKPLKTDGIIKATELFSKKENSPVPQT